MRYTWMIIAAAVAASPAIAAEPKTAELRGNQWIELTGPSTEPSSDPELAQIDRLVQQKRNTESQKRLIAWFAANPESPMRDRALYLMAQALYQYGNRIKAFYYLDELMDEHPDSALFYPALELQFQIADEYLDGYKRRVFGISLLGAQEEAVDMLYRVRQRSPGSPLAEKALLRTADYYYAAGDYDLAGDAYAWYAREYPRSPAIARVKLRQAFSNYAQFRGLRFDATPLVDARTELAEIIAIYPDLAEEERLPAVIQRIDRTFAEKLYVTADYYRRTNQPRAAAYTYRYLLDVYPTTPEAVKARRALERIPESVLETLPPPRSAPDGSPLTRVEP